MSEIDWSKAPEGYPVWIQGRDKHFASGWYREISDRFINEDGRYYLKSDWQLFTVRARPSPAWSGEGLPPVGTVCQVIDRLSNEFTKQFNGKRVEIIAHSKDENHDTAVFRVIGFLYDGESRYHSLVAGCFEKIRTPEKIAADEREAACEEMLEIAKSRRADPDVYEAIATLYDAGFRKP